MGRSVAFDGGVVSIEYPDVTVICTDAVTGAERWRASFEPAIPERQTAGSYVCFSYAVARNVDGLLLVVSFYETTRGATPAYTNVHRVLEGGRVAWGLIVDPQGGDVAIRRTGERLEILGAGVAWLVDVESGAATLLDPSR